MLWLHGPAACGLECILHYAHQLGTAQPPGFLFGTLVVSGLCLLDVHQCCPCVLCSLASASLMCSLALSALRSAADIGDMTAPLSCTDLVPAFLWYVVLCVASTCMHAMMPCIHACVCAHPLLLLLQVLSYSEGVVSTRCALY